MPPSLSTGRRRVAGPGGPTRIRFLPAPWTPLERLPGPSSPQPRNAPQWSHIQEHRGHPVKAQRDVSEEGACTQDHGL
ncbi:hypothetical protein Celaphus_00010298 [Cervus elaphus hippelaphus]|uniref:Uncharacterized protein n=1 Tax=Cervus elaphus hippelaphus TaxID=46360 RepID=A0A212CA08_CEREH|nr:hypothetical protein Celaphus_00010298 [Cervus elaphus hippelaphus]